MKCTKNTPNSDQLPIARVKANPTRCTLRQTQRGTHSDQSHVAHTLPNY